ncbi:YggS family pyridoxal phosphate enzyme [Halobacteriovorax marinus]|uniref:Pyridoxal phosphate homeostasis protein n=1 Tax=Halobacteriovorax marinus TaxID=97084 RepID=A0A1Y5FCV7_9BACT|nr:YggS family pyridoxal phosphate enzyme [Halobacteriovorax marinus]
MNRRDLLNFRFKNLKKKIVQINSPHKKSDLTVVAVTKYSPIEDIEISYDIGHRHFGENRVLDLQEKAEHMLDLGFDDISWHFIGNLQSKKVNRLLKIPGLGFIHSIDSLSLLETILKKSDQFRGERLGLFLQVNTSDEAEKQGFDSYDKLAGAVNLFLEATDSKFYFAGLMTMGKLRTDNFEKDARHCFQKLKEHRSHLSDDFGLNKLALSMGMSSDFEIAIDESTDFIRVGSSLYAEE